ncbi:MAG: dephospho-CoA kinase [Chitinispirillales bacterium]|nr:dephospho-CoA kinase [Chitinispirillales bacterium]
MGFLDDCIPPDGGCKAAIAALAVVPPVNWFAGASMRGVRVGIAGYMGAGKSTCARSFEPAGALVIDADAEAKRLMRGSVDILDRLRRAFGDDVAGDGELRVEALGRAAFGSVDALRTLNGIVHPPLVGHLEALIVECVKPLCILDAALIPLWNIEPWFDLCVWIDAPFDTRLERIAAKGGGVDEREISRRMRMQEEVMGVPAGERWVRVPDGACREYIAGEINKRR